jgi:hypothetical protein
VSDLPDWIGRLQRNGCEVGVHGIDSWQSIEKGKEERNRIGLVTGEPKVGIRMHWLLSEADTPRVLEQAGYDYDSTNGYNETPGYRAGTGQVYRPIGAESLLELPLHIQDGALFYPQRLDLPDSDAWEMCTTFIRHAQSNGGVLTLLWHDRSHGPERFWGDFYARLVSHLRTLNVWFGTAGEVVEWFRARRLVTFGCSLDSTGAARVVAQCPVVRPKQPFVLRTYRPAAIGATTRSGSTYVDVPWSGENALNLSALSADSRSAAHHRTPNKTL